MMEAQRYEIGSLVCRVEHFSSPWYRRWQPVVEPELRSLLDALGAPPDRPRLHRKSWEWAAVLAAMDERGLLRESVRAVGFAVGSEPIASILASRGVTVVASDLPHDSKAAVAWEREKQFAASLEALERPHLVSPEDFRARTTFVPADMNEALPFVQRSFDAVWSCCAVEHLGTIEKGLDFLLRASRLLRPGGFAFHTIEFNVSSNWLTVARGETVLFRRRDLERLGKRLAAEGLTLAPLDTDPGDAPDDRRYDVNPYYGDPTREHVKLRLRGHVTTSLLLVIGA